MSMAYSGLPLLTLYQLHHIPMKSQHKGNKQSLKIRFHETGSTTTCLNFLKLTGEISKILILGGQVMTEEFRMQCVLKILICYIRPVLPSLVDFM